MEQILAFVLGLGIGTFILVVVSAFKTAKLAKQNEQSIRNLEEWLSRNDELINRRIDQEIDRVDQISNNIYSTIDSRLDKLETKIISNKQVIKG